MLSALRRVPEYARAAENGVWTPIAANVVPDALADKTVLIVGYGSVGAAVERRLAGFEVDVLRVARTPRPAEGVAGLEDLPALLPRADVVVLTVPATAE